MLKEITETCSLFVDLWLLLEIRSGLWLQQPTKFHKELEERLNISGWDLFTIWQSWLEVFVHVLISKNIKDKVDNWDENNRSYHLIIDFSLPFCQSLFYLSIRCDFLLNYLIIWINNLEFGIFFFHFSSFVGSIVLVYAIQQ